MIVSKDYLLMMDLFSNYSGTFPNFDKDSDVLQIKLKPALYEIISIVITNILYFQNKLLIF